MRNGFTLAYHWIALVIAVGAVVQFFLAGVGVFGADSFDAHEGLGWMLHTAAILVVICAIIGPRTGRAIGTAIGFFALFTLQVMLPGLQDDSPWLAAFHPLLALGVLGMAVHIGLPAISRRRAGSAPRPAG
jgi:Family of unknown function (DUF6220)